MLIELNIIIVIVYIRFKCEVEMARKRAEEYTEMRRRRTEELMKREADTARKRAERANETDGEEGDGELRLGF